MQKETVFSRMISEQSIKVLAYKIRNPNTANPKPQLLSIVELPILANVLF